MGLARNRFRFVCNRYRHRRGAVALFCCIQIIVLAGICSLAVDFAHVEVVKAQLQNATDAAARAAAAQLIVATGCSGQQEAIATAIQVAAENNVDGQPLVLLSSDVLIGNFDSTQNPSFSAARTPINAVQVNAARCAARSTAVFLTFGAVVNATSCDVHASATATSSPPGSNYGFAGVNRVSFGSVNVMAQVIGDVASNGNIVIGSPLGLFCSVTGGARTYNGSVTKGVFASIGSTQNLSQALTYPSVTLPTGNNNDQISQYLDANSNFTGAGLVNVPAGSYVVHDLNILADVEMNLQGPVTFYVTGAFNMAAAINLLGGVNSNPAYFNVLVGSSGTVNFTAAILSPLCMNLYAPDSDITINVGISSYTGELVGRTLSMNLPILSTFREVKPGAVPRAVMMVK